MPKRCILFLNKIQLFDVDIFLAYFGDHLYTASPDELLKRLLRTFTDAAFAIKFTDLVVARRILSSNVALEIEKPLF